MDWLDDVHVGEVEEAEDLGWLDSDNAEAPTAAGAAAADRDMTEAAESGMQLAAGLVTQPARAAAETVRRSAESAGAGSNGAEEAAAAIADAVVTETEHIITTLGWVERLKLSRPYRRPLWPPGTCPGPPYAGTRWLASITIL